MIQFYHQLIQFSAKKSYRQFCNKFDQLKEIQLGKIGGDYQVFIKQNPITTYADFETEAKKILSQKKIHCVPTSGSTAKIKWIPYTSKFKNELWMATAPWLYDLYLHYPSIKKGKHFWSLSWLPNDLRKNHQTDDLEVMNFVEKILMRQTMALDNRVAFSPTLEQAMRQSALALMNKNITVISVWSPTFLLEILELIFSHKNFFMANSNSRPRSILEKHSHLSPEFCLEMWPDLKLISMWDTGSSKFFALKVATLFPQTTIQGKGLWATEGVVSIPFENKYLLAYQSHFYEFQCVETQQIYPAWDCRPNLVANVILTTGSGLTRYQLGDQVRVTEIYRGIPCIEFLGRQKEFDLVGEKISSSVFQEILDSVHEKFQVNALCFLAKSKPYAHYELLVEGDDINKMSSILEFSEHKLREHFHYRLARDTHQLQKLSINISKDARNIYMNIASQKIAIRGNIKMEPALIIGDQ